MRLKAIAVLIVLCAAGFASAGAPSPASCVSNIQNAVRADIARLRADFARIPPGDTRRAVEIRRIRILGAIDQRARDGVTMPIHVCGMGLGDPTFLQRIGPYLIGVDRENQALLHPILSRIGWPVISKYGKETDSAAFYVVQHADLAWQRAVLSTLERLVSQKETDPDNFALMFDRVQVESGKPQRYGTQGTCKGTNWVSDPLEDASNVDARRKALGLPSYESYLAQVTAQYCRP